MRTLRIIILVHTACSLLTAGTNGTLEGRVIDRRTGEALPGASVRIVGMSAGSVTEADGYYAVNNIPAGAYSITVSYVGYVPVTVTGVRIRSDVKTRLDVGLDESTVVVSAVTVTAERPAIQKDVTGSSYTGTEETFTRLPVTTVADVIGLQPGVTLENNIRGGKTTEVIYLVDGLPVQNLIEGGAGAELPQSSIAEVSIQTGGFDPEYGNALSGVVNIVTKRGDDRHSISVRANKDDLFGGQQTDRRTEADVLANGPVGFSTYYLASINAVMTDTRWRQDLRRFFPAPVSRSFSGFGKLDHLVGASIRLSAQIMYSSKQWREYEYAWRFNLDGLPPRSEDGIRAAFILSQTLAENMYYTASISRHRIESRINDIDKGVLDTTLFQWDFFLRYIVDGNRAWWASRRQVHNLVKIDGTWRLDAHHMLKAGAEVNFQEIYSDIVRYEPQLNIFGKPFVNKPMLDYSTDFRYFPRMGSAYLQDKIELSRDGMLLNLGVRYEFLDPRAERPIAERTQAANDVFQTTIVRTVPASVKHLLSPRIGFAAPFVENGYLFINYGHYYQFPLFDFLYSGLNNVSVKKGTGVLVGNPDLKPEQNRSWEMSLKYAVGRGLVLSGTYFHKETMNQIDVKTFVPTNSSVAGDYGFAEFVNNPYATSNGIELMAVKEQGDVLTGSISYTYMTAEGVSESPKGGLQYYQWGLPVPAKPYPLSWDQRHAVKAILSLKLPFDVLASATWMFRTGRPYTYYPSNDGFTPSEQEQRFEPNNARMNGFDLLNLKIGWTRRWMEQEKMLYGISLYCDVRNVFNTKNVRWVDSAGRVGGELGDLSAYDPNRRVRVGVGVEL